MARIVARARPIEMAMASARVRARPIEMARAMAYAKGKGAYALMTAFASWLPLAQQEPSLRSIKQP